MEPQGGGGWEGVLSVRGNRSKRERAWMGQGKSRTRKFEGWRLNGIWITCLELSINIRGQVDRGLPRQGLQQEKQNLKVFEVQRISNTIHLQHVKETVQIERGMQRENIQGFLNRNTS